MTLKGSLKEKKGPKEKETRSLREYGEMVEAVSPLSTLDGSLKLLPIQYWRKQAVTGGNSTTPCASRLRTTKVYNLPRTKKIRHDSISKNLLNIYLSIVGIFCIIYYKNQVFKSWELWRIKINSCCHRYSCIIILDNNNNPHVFKKKL